MKWEDIEINLRNNIKDITDNIYLPREVKCRRALIEKEFGKVMDVAFDINRSLKKAEIPVQLVAVPFLNEDCDKHLTEKDKEIVKAFIKGTNLDCSSRYFI